MSYDPHSFQEDLAVSAASTTPLLASSSGGDVILHQLFELKQQKARLLYEIDVLEQKIVEQYQSLLPDEGSKTFAAENLELKLTLTAKNIYKLDASEEAIEAARSANLLEESLSQTKTKRLKQADPALWLQLSHCITSAPSKVNIKIEATPKK